MSDVSADMKIGVNEGSNESMGDDPGPKGIPVTDRNSPGWVRVFSWVFSICSFGLIASLAVFASFFDSIVIESGERFVVPLLFLGGVTALLGLLLFEFAHARALAGYRPSRGIFASQAQAFAGIFLAGVLTFVHPLAGVGIALGTAVGAFGLLILSKLKRNEPFWDFLPSEAATILAGRDTEGFRLAQVDTREHSLADSVHVVGSGVAFLVSLGITSDLAARLVLSPSAVLSFSLITLLSSYAIIKWVRMVVRDPDASEILPAVVEPMPDPADDHDAGGLSVSGLTVTNLDGQSLLSDIAFRAEPGRITGIIGESGSGKSLLLSSLSDPFGFIDMHVRGRVRINGVDPWQRTNRARSLALSYVPDAPIMLPASGQENLACFMDGPVLDQGKRMLEQLVFASDLVDQICQTKNASLLPGMQKKALALARSFLLSPDVYLIDKPEDHLPEKQISAVLTRIQSEVRLGRSFLLVSDHRAFLDACDAFVVLSKGRVVDYGPATEIRARQSAGWARFVGDRSLEIEENLTNWIRSHFKRPGDEPNRRKVCLIAAEMLAFSCQNKDTLDVSRLRFEFKHFEGHCLLRMQDSSPPISSAQLARAQEESEGKRKNQRLSPLAGIIENSLDVEAHSEREGRVLTAKIETFNPRHQKSNDVQQTEIR